MNTLFVWKGLESLPSIRNALVLHQRADLEFPPECRDEVAQLFRRHDGREDLLGALSSVPGLSRMRDLRALAGDLAAQVAIGSDDPPILHLEIPGRAH